MQKRLAITRKLGLEIRCLPVDSFHGGKPRPSLIHDHLAGAGRFLHLGPLRRRRGPRRGGTSRRNRRGRRGRAACWRPPLGSTAAPLPGSRNVSHVSFSAPSDFTANRAISGCALRLRRSLRCGPWGHAPPRSRRTASPPPLPVQGGRRRNPDTGPSRCPPAPQSPRLAGNVTRDSVSTAAIDQ